MCNERRRLLLLFTLLSVAASTSSCSRARPRTQPVAAGATVLALGDSLTFGTGAAPDASYPAVLAGLTGWRIVNAGVPGDTAAQALERLPESLRSDQIHANAKGYARFAQSVAATAVAAGLLVRR